MDEEQQQMKLQQQNEQAQLIMQYLFDIVNGKCNNDSSSNEDLNKPQGDI